MVVFMFPHFSKSKIFCYIRLHDYNQKYSDPKDQINIKGFAVGNGCTHETECEFQNDYGPYLMQLYRDYGFITQEMFEEVDSKCNNKQVLPDDCVAMLDQVFFCLL